MVGTDKALWLQCKTRLTLYLRWNRKESVEDTSTNVVHIYCLYTRKMTHRTWGIKRNLITSTAVLLLYNTEYFIHTTSYIVDSSFFIYLFSLIFLSTRICVKVCVCLHILTLYIMYAWLNGYLVENKKRRPNFRQTNGRYRGGI